MKEFEKWNNSLDFFEKRYHDLERKKGWKAALEWALSWETDSESIEIIEKELGNKAI